MSSLLNIIEPYLRTFIHTWWLRPRKFMEIKANDKRYSQHLAPIPFFLVSLSIIATINLGWFSFDEVRSSFENIFSKGEVNGFVIFFVSISIILLLINTVIYFAISKLWPLRGEASILQVFEVNCYMTSMQIPLAVIQLLLAPWWSDIFIFSKESNQLKIADEFLIIMYIYSIIIFLFWFCPFIAFVNNVSTIRVVAATAMWIIILSIVSTLIFLGLATAIPLIRY